MTSLAPALLLSMPQLADPNFSRTVVLLCQHIPDEGAFGLVLNRPIVTSGRVTVNLEPPASTDRELQMWVGGPVEPQRTWVLVGGDCADAQPGCSLTVAPGLCLSASPWLLRQAIESSLPPRSRLMVGYAGWAPGQLEAELEASAWLVSEVDPALIFDTPAELIWERAIRRLGADPANLQTSRGVH